MGAGCRGVSSGTAARPSHAFVQRNGERTARARRDPNLSLDVGLNINLRARQRCSSLWKRRAHLADVTAETDAEVGLARVRQRKEADDAAERLRLLRRRLDAYDQALGGHPGGLLALRSPRVIKCWDGRRQRFPEGGRAASVPVSAMNSTKESDLTAR